MTVVKLKETSMKKILLTALMVCAVTACSEKEPSVQKAVPPSSGPNLTQTPDVGKVELVAVKANGTGITPGAAINDALKMAVTQINGVHIESISANLTAVANLAANLDVETSSGKDNAKVYVAAQSQSFSEAVIAQSNGLIKSFKVLKMTSPSSGSNLFTTEIEAQIAKFKGPVDDGKIKIVVSPLRSNKASFEIGDRQIPAAEILGPIRQQIIDALSQTGRFTILDRQFEKELESELNMITSGKAVDSDIAKLGQALSADLVWVGVVNNLSYQKHVRKLQTSDRDLVSYSGGWSVSQRMINLATRQIQQSNTIQGAPPAIAPTTLGAKHDESATLKNIQGEIVKKVTEAIVLRTFPVTIVKRDGNAVVLSQGGQTVSENGHYRIYLQGSEIKDPQTGRSLGNLESICCDVKIDRITPNLSYGTLENIKIDLSNVQPGALQIREAIPDVPTVKVASQAATEPTEIASKPAPKQPVPTKDTPPVGAKKQVKADDW